MPFQNITARLRSDVAFAVMTTIATSSVKLVSSLILTRLLTPHAYGVVAAVMSIGYIIEMMSDIAVGPYLVRHRNAGDPLVSNTIWTARLARSSINALLLVTAAPWIAGLYGMPELSAPLQVYSLYFVLFSLESLGFNHADRLGRPKLRLKIDLIVGIFTTLVTLVLAKWWRADHWAIIVGMLVGLLPSIFLTHRFGMGPPVRLAWSRPVLAEMWLFSRVILPSSILSMILSQLERVAVPKLFDATTLGLLGVAGSIAGIVLTLNYRIVNSLLYPRLALAARTPSSSLREGFYQRCRNMQWMMLAIPAAVGGAAVTIIDILFDARYHGAGMILAALMLRSVGLAMLISGESAMTAAGQPRVQLFTNIVRIAWVAVAGYTAYRFADVTMFFWAVCLDTFVGLLVAWGFGRRHDLFTLVGELQRFAVAAIAWLGSAIVATFVVFPLWKLLLHR